MLTNEQRNELKKKYFSGTTTSTQSVSDRIKRVQEIAKGTETQPTIQTEQKKSLLQKASDMGEKYFLKPLTETFVAPLARELERPFVSLTKGVQGLIPGGKTGKESVATPFGDVKPYSELSSGEATMGAVEAGLTVLPVEKAVSPIIKPVTKFFSGFAKRLGGSLSGKGVSVIEKIIENPQAAKIGLRGDEVEVLKKTASSARTGVKQLSQKSGQDYEKAIDALPEVANIDVNKLVNKITTKFDDFGIKLENGTLDFSTSPLDEAQERVVTKMWDLMKQPRKYDNPKDLNNLARQISKFRKTTDPELNNIVDATRRAIRDTVSEEVPELRTALQKYSKEQDFLDAVESELSIKGATDSTEGILQTSRKLQTVFNSNKELTRQLLSEFEGKTGKDLLATEAGRQIASAPSRAQVSIGDVARNIVQTVIPPKAVGEIAVAVGVSKQKIKPFVSLLNQFAPAERIAIFNLFSSQDGIQTTEKEQMK